MTLYPTVGIIGKRRDPRVQPTLLNLCALLRERGRHVVIDSDTAQLLPDHDYPQVERAALGRRCDLAVVVGGDGTLLDAGRSLAVAGIPILGVNQGRLGFLVDVPPDDIGPTLDAVFAGQAQLDERPLLEARILHSDNSAAGPLLAVNDVVLRNQATIRMLEFETWLDGALISAHRADGMIIATPTGSTAYALSGGGPIMHPALDAVTLVPICPHTLSDRPIVVGASTPIRIVLRGDVAGATITCDGQTNVVLEPDDAIEIAHSHHRLRLLHPPQYDYFAMLRSKLQWGRGLSGLNENTAC